MIDVKTNPSNTINKEFSTEKSLKDKLDTANAPVEILAREIGKLAWSEILRDVFADGEAKWDEPQDEVDREVCEAFVEWAKRSRLDDLEDLLFIKTDGSPLTGRVPEAQLAARKLVQATQFHHNPLAGLILYTLAPTLRRWEGLQMATPENFGDFLLSAFGGEGAPSPQSTQPLTDFGVRLWRLLRTQKDQDIDYWRTVRAFGDFFVGAKGPDTLALAATAYHTVILMQAKNAEDADAADLIRGAANNMASLFDDLAGKSPSELETKTIAAAGHLHVIASDAIGDRWRMSPAERRARALDELGNTPTTFQQDGSDSLRLRYLRQAWFSVRTGVVRARLRTPGEDDAKDVASAFFNAGVAILRTGSRRSAQVVTARIAVNALGLWWALYLAPHDEKKALGSYSGGDCAVNLFGALTDLDENLIERLRAVIAPLWAALYAERRVLGVTDTQRIATSVKEMKLPESPSENEASLTMAVNAFLERAAGLLGLPWLAEVVTAGHEPEERQRAAYQSWRAAASALCPLVRADGGIVRLCRPVWRTLNRIPPRLDELPEAIAANWLAFLGDRHPLVAAGLMTAEELHALLARGKDAPESLGEWMEKNAWTLAGALAR